MGQGLLEIDFLRHVSMSSSKTKMTDLRDAQERFCTFSCLRRLLFLSAFASHFREVNHREGYAKCQVQTIITPECSLIPSVTSNTFES